MISKLCRRLAPESSTGTSIILGKHEYKSNMNALYTIQSYNCLRVKFYNVFAFRAPECATVKLLHSFDSSFMLWKALNELMPRAGQMVLDPSSLFTRHSSINCLNAKSSYIMSIQK